MNTEEFLEQIEEKQGVWLAITMIQPNGDISSIEEFRCQNNRIERLAVNRNASYQYDIQAFLKDFRGYTFEPIKLIL